MPYISNKIIPTNQNINISTNNTYNEDDSAFTVNASESTKNSKTKGDRETKTNKFESIRNCKKVQIPSNNLTINQINNTNTSIFDYTQQNQTLISNSNNKIFDDNNIDVNIKNMLKISQLNFQNNENFNFSNKKQAKGLHKKNSCNNLTNIYNPNNVDPKANLSEIAGAAQINVLQGCINPYLIQSNNVPISLNLPIPLANQPLINPMNRPAGNSGFSTSNQIRIKNDIENSAFFNSQNVNSNSNVYNMEAENDEESEESKEDEYVLELIYTRRFSELSDKDLLSNLFLIAKEQAGCRFLQQKIDDNPNFANYELYPEIHEYIGEFICDPFSNYLVQKMLESLTTDKINHMMKNVN